MALHLLGMFSRETATRSAERNCRFRNVTLNYNNSEFTLAFLNQCPLLAKHMLVSDRQKMAVKKELVAMRWGLAESC